jgi:hypothetical protein
VESNAPGSINPAKTHKTVVSARLSSHFCHRNRANAGVCLECPARKYGIAAIISLATAPK